MLDIDPNAVTKERLAFRLAVLSDAIVNNRINEQIRSGDDVDYGDIRGFAEKVMVLSAKATPENHEKFAVTPDEYNLLGDIVNKWDALAAYGGQVPTYTPMGRDMNYVS